MWHSVSPRGLALLAFAIAAALGAASLACMLAFLALQGAYSLWLKSVELADVLAIAALFVLRAAAGAIAVDVRISPWLLVCTFLLALFLALAKRRAELRLELGARPALAGYSAGVLDRLLALVAVGTVVVYAAYTVAAYDSLLLVATVPLVAFGLVRYLRLLLNQGPRRGARGRARDGPADPRDRRRLGSRLRGRYRDRVKRPSPS